MKIQELKVWLKKRLPTQKDIDQHLFGDCADLAEEIISELGYDSNYEQWELWDLDKKYKRLPLIVKGNAKLPFLCDIGEVWHIVIKWKGFYWDACGAHNNLRVKMEHYNKCPNPHWLRTG